MHIADKLFRTCESSVLFALCEAEITGKLHDKVTVTCFTEDISLTDPQNSWPPAD